MYNTSAFCNGYQLEKAKPELAIQYLKELKLLKIHEIDT